MPQVPQWLRFLLVGGMAAGVNWLARFPLSLWFGYLSAVLLANLIGMVVGFVAYRAFVFQSGTRRIDHQIRDFILVNLVSLVVVAGVALLCRSILVLVTSQAVAEAAAHAIGIAAGAVSNYLGHSRITFARVVA